MRNSLCRYASDDQKGNMLITVDDIVKALNLLGFEAKSIDRHDLTWWIFNSNLIVSKVPKQFNQEVIFVYVDKLVDALQEEYVRMGFM